MTYQLCSEYVEKRLVFFLLLLLLVSATVYSGSLRNGFVWDDHDIVENYSRKHSLSSLPYLLNSSDSISGWPETPFYRPLARAWYLLDFRVFGLEPWGYHFENLLLHLANILLLFLVARSVLKETFPALIAAALFAVHPAISEPVFAVFARNTLLACAFSMAAFLAFERGHRTQQTTWFLISSVLFFLGLLSKETAIAVFPVLAWYCYEERRPFGRYILMLLPFAAVIAVYLLLRHNALAGVLPESHSTTLFQRMLQNVYIIPRYLLLLIAPFRLTVLHEISPQSGGLTVMLAMVWIFLIGGVAALVKFGGQGARFGLFWGMSALVPVLGVVEIPGGPLAERHLYLPFAGFALTGAVVAAAVLRRHAAAGLGFLCILLALGMLRTAARSADWRNDVALFKQAVDVNPASVTAHYNLGNAYVEAGNLGLAIRESMSAVRLDPHAADALYQLGSQLLSAQRYQEAQPYLERAVAARPDWFYARSNLATVLDVQNKREEAIHQYEKTLAVVPPDRRDSIPKIRERLEQLRGNAPDAGVKILIRKELLQ